MGSFESLIYLSDYAITFSKIILNLQAQLRTAQNKFSIVRGALDTSGVDLNIDEQEDIMNKDGSLSDDEPIELEKKLFISRAKEIMRESKNIVDTIDSTIDELNGAKELIHPDQKKIFSLQSRIKELEVALPLHKIKKLAILNELPRFIKHELSDTKVYIVHIVCDFAVITQYISYRSKNNKRKHVSYNVYVKHEKVIKKRELRHWLMMIFLKWILVILNIRMIIINILMNMILNQKRKIELKILNLRWMEYPLVFKHYNRD